MGNFFEIKIYVERCIFFVLLDLIVILCYDRMDLYVLVVIKLLVLYI